MKVLLTNDDGIHVDGLQTLRRALVRIPGIQVVVIAPDSNRSAFARKISTRTPLWIEEVEFDDGTIGYATDGTPVDCVRFMDLELVEGFQADLIVSGINHGSNLGDDITYSGTVAAAFEGIILGIPGIAVSQQSVACEMDFRAGHEFHFDVAARFVARLVEELESVPLPEGTLLNVNVPAGEVEAVEVARLGKRIYQDELKLLEADGPRRRFRVYGQAHGHFEDAGTDLAAIAAGKIAVTPIHFDLTHHDGIDSLSGYDLSSLLERPAREIDA